jgi:hypothetical protein
MSLPDEISNFGSLVGLMLALAALLTASRSSRIGKLGEKPKLSADERRREVALDLLLAAATIITFLGGLPLAVRACHDIHPLAHEGPIRSVLIMVWLLLLGLIGWQISLARVASKLELAS